MRDPAAGIGVCVGRDCGAQTACETRLGGANRVRGVVARRALHAGRGCRARTLYGLGVGSVQPERGFCTKWPISRIF